MPEWAVLAVIRRARGIRGEVAASLAGSAPERFQPEMNLWLVRGDSEKPVTVEKAWMHQDELVLKFKGLDTRNDAEELRGMEVCVPVEDREPAPEGEYYLSDLVGCRVETTDGRVLGEVRAWHEFGAAPLLEVFDGSRELLVPFAEAFYRKVDTEGKLIVVELPEGLEELNQK